MASTALLQQLVKQLSEEKKTNKSALATDGGTIGRPSTPNDLIGTEQDAQDSRRALQRAQEGWSPRLTSPLAARQEKMLDKFGVYPTANVSGGGTDGSYQGGGRAGIVAQLMDNLTGTTGVSGQGSYTHGSGVNVVPTHYDASLNYTTDGYGDFGVGGKFNPNSKDYSVFAKWKKKF
jgi:hypothetical protein